MKQCSRCKEWKDEGEFGPNKRNKNGLLAYCRSCGRDMQTAWRNANKDKVQKRNRQRYANDPAKYRGYTAAWRKRHAEEIRERHCANYDPERQRIYNQRYRVKHP